MFTNTFFILNYTITSPYPLRGFVKRWSPLAQANKVSVGWLIKPFEGPPPPQFFIEFKDGKILTGVLAQHIVTK